MSEFDPDEVIRYLDGPYLLKRSGVLLPNVDSVCSPQMLSWTADGVFSFVLEQVANEALTLTAAVEHRNFAEQTWTTAGNFPSVGSVGTYVVALLNLKELFRFRFSIPEMPGEVGFRRIRILPTTWS